ncbi:MAG: hypothetical protein DRH17_12685 [Deltaproteobacteria bacterium]|nr:MAG: hypothetical protein DRH17_12685 [Deltaproteobacteria bacterium]
MSINITLNRLFDEPEIMIKNYGTKYIAKNYNGEKLAESDTPDLGELVNSILSDNMAIRLADGKYNVKTTIDLSGRKGIALIGSHLPVGKIGADRGVRLVCDVDPCIKSDESPYYGSVTDIQGDPKTLTLGGFEIGGTTNDVSAAPYLIWLKWVSGLTVFNVRFFNGKRGLYCNDCLNVRILFPQTGGCDVSGNHSTSNDKWTPVEVGIEIDGGPEYWIFAPFIEHGAGDGILIHNTNAQWGVENVHIISPYINWNDGHGINIKRVTNAGLWLIKIIGGAIDENWLNGLNVETSVGSPWNLKLWVALNQFQSNGRSGNSGLANVYIKGYDSNARILDVRLIGNLSANEFKYAPDLESYHIEHVDGLLMIGELSSAPPTLVDVVNPIFGANGWPEGRSAVYARSGLPSSGNYVGEMVFDTSSGQLCVWDGSAWKCVSLS